MIRTFQPVYRGDRPGHTWAEIVTMHQRLGDAPQCSTTTLERARRSVMENVRIDGGSFWKLKPEHVYGDDERPPPCPEAERGLSSERQE